MGNCYATLLFHWQNRNHESKAMITRGHQRSLRQLTACIAELAAFDAFIVEIPADSPYRDEALTFLNTIRIERRQRTTEKQALMKEMDVSAAFSHVATTTIMRKSDTKHMARRQKKDHKNRIRNVRQNADDTIARQHLLAEQTEEIGDTVLEITDETNDMLSERLAIAEEAVDALCVVEEEEDDHGDDQDLEANTRMLNAIAQAEAEAEVDALEMQTIAPPPSPSPSPAKTTKKKNKVQDTRTLVVM